MALVAIAVPLAAKALRRVGQRMQTRQSGNSRMGDAMQKAASGMDFFGRGNQSRYAGSRW